MFTYIFPFLHTGKDVLAKDHVDRHTEFWRIWDSWESMMSHEGVNFDGAKSVQR